MFKFFTVGALLLTLTACASVIENRSPINETFPNVTGTNLNKQSIAIPDGLEGDLKVLLIGYVERSQFDIDRWLIGLDMTQTPVPAYELPTIAGMFPQMFETFIDNGMRKGIPKSMWGGVITIYDGAEKITALTGTENRKNARVILINSAGKILYFYDRGFAVDALNNLRETIREYQQQTASK
ncbi:hypothetical protein QWY77_00855 [Thalassotalea ponticola]|uniref:hypothetical protein n=1 Tax=Thalassotalea ponticola TaxID=1523392 RepID=UPI0025B2977D|nr:hypothetical protein [Thalassotalea ponticola]MDN3651334.1 hypothetical protein [Thalassotalea ponticola]